MTAHQQPHEPLTHQTRHLATQALKLHRLALAAQDASNTRSPYTPATYTNGTARPTEDAALCPRRAHVADTVARVARGLAEHLAALDGALAAWDSPTAP